MINLTKTQSKESKKENENKVKDLKKKSITKKFKLDLTKLKDDNYLLNLDLDKLNLTDFNKVMDSKKESIKTSNKNIELYKSLINVKDSKERKKVRKQIRNKRNKFISNFIYYYNNKNKVEIQKTIKDFNTFYKKEYVLNDYSLNSLCANNTDKETKFNILLLLKGIKDSK